MGVQLGLETQVDIHVGTQGTTGIFILSRIAIILEILDESLVGEELDIGIVTEVARTTLELQVEAVIVGYIAEGLVCPVDIRIIKRVGSVLVSIDDSVTIDSRTILVTISLINCRSISSCISHLWLVIQVREHVVVRESKRLGVVLTMLGGYQDYAVGTLVTIKSGSSGILQYLNTLHILSYDILDGTLHSIHDEERCATTGRLNTTDIESRILRIVDTCTIQAHKPRALT